MYTGATRLIYLVKTLFFDDYQSEKDIELAEKTKALTELQRNHQRLLNETTVNPEIELMESLARVQVSPSRRDIETDSMDIEGPSTENLGHTESLRNDSKVCVHLIVHVYMKMQTMDPRFRVILKDAEATGGKETLQILCWPPR